MIARRVSRVGRLRPAPLLAALIVLIGSGCEDHAFDRPAMYSLDERPLRLVGTGQASGTFDRPIDGDTILSLAYGEGCTTRGGMRIETVEDSEIVYERDLAAEPICLGQDYVWDGTSFKLLDEPIGHTAPQEAFRLERDK